MDWKEIERLQADFQRTQLSTTTQRLSERNCIEILMKLQEMQMIDVLHSCDGKEYLTPTQLTREIQDEVHIRGGRVNLVDLQQTLNIDFSYVEAKCQELVASNEDYQLVYGRLIENSYLDSIAEEINDNLQACGQIKLSDVSKSYDIPGEFLLQELMKRLGSIIHGKVDQQSKETIYTDAFLDRHKSRIRGVLTAVTRPLPINFLHAASDLPLHLIFVIIEELIREGRINGQVVGGRSVKSTFLPRIHTQTQKQWIDNFYKQNDYLEYDTVARLGISDAKSYLKQRFGSGNFPPVFLKSVCVGRAIVDHVTSVVEETITSGEDWCDVTTILPSSFTENDCSELLRQVIRDRNKPQGVVFGETIATSQSFVDSCSKHFDELIRERAEKEANSKSVLILTEDEKKAHLSHLASSESNKKADKKEERRRKAAEGQGGQKKSGEAGSGVGAREAKTRGKDKKRLKWKKEEMNSKAASTKHHHDNEEVFMELDELEEVLSERMPECPEELVREIAEKLLRPLDAKYRSAIKSVFQERSSAQGGEGGRTRKQVEEEINTLWANARLFSGSLQFFTGDAVVSITKHLLQTICTRITNHLFIIAAKEFEQSACVADDVTEEVRIKFLSRFPSNVKLPLTTLNASLRGKSFADFESALTEATSSSACDVFLKNADKKKDRQTMHGHKMSLLQQLNDSDEPAMTLHLCSLVIFQTVTGMMLDVTGRHVPVIIDKLQEYVDRDTFVDLVRYQELVVKSSRLQGADNEELTRIDEELSSGMKRIKELATTTKKSHS